MTLPPSPSIAGPSRTLPATAESIGLLGAALTRGELVAMPTETVYGLAADCKNAAAVAQIFSAKARPSFDPLIVHVAFDVGHKPLLSDLGESGQKCIDLGQLSETLQEKIQTLIDRFWPGPLTLILPKHSSIPDLVTSGLGSVGIRMPSHPAAQALIRASGSALAAPSANRFGRISPTTAEAVFEELGDRIPWILDGGPCAVGIESTVLGFDKTGSPWILRQGGVPQAALAEALGESLNRDPSQPEAQIQTLSPGGPLPGPGLLDSHYAPRKNLFLLKNSLDELTQASLAERDFPLFPPQPVGVLALQGKAEELKTRLEALLDRPVILEVLSPSGSLNQMAQNLFSALRRLDNSPAAFLISERCLATEGLGYGISDRLLKASTKNDRKALD